MVNYTKPHQTRASDLRPAWHVIDAQGKTLGRLSSEIAVLLQGKHKPNFVYYLNTGDFVVVVNADKVRVTGKKLDQKLYYRHSGYPGGLKQQTLSQLLQKTPTRVIQKAVKGMLPKNTMGRRMLSRLKLYAGGSHPHAAQVNALPKAAKVEAPPDTTPRAETVEAPQKPAPKTARAKGARKGAAPTEALETQAQPDQTTQPVEAEASEAVAQPDETTQVAEAEAPEAVAQPKAAAKAARKTRGPRAARQSDAKDEGEAPKAAPEPEEA